MTKLKKEFDEEIIHSIGLVIDRDYNSALNILRLGKPFGASSLMPSILNREMPKVRRIGGINERDK